MERRCRITGRKFAIADEDLRLLELLSPQIGGRIHPLPPPSICPDERKRRRLAFRNERRLYRRTCSLTGKPIVSAYSPDKPYQIYSTEAWWSDRWNALDYGRDFDFSRPFFEQLAELDRVTPHIAVVATSDAEAYNCRYVNFAGSNRNCYLIFDSDYNEDSYYSNVLKHSKNCIDCSYVSKSELCCQCIDCTSCYNLLFSSKCLNCSNSALLESCIGCSDCLFCCNLVQKRFHYRNKPCSREEFEAIKSSLTLGGAAAAARLPEEFRGFSQQYPKKYCQVLKGENCCGDYIVNAKNCWQCFNVGEVEDLRYCDSVYSAKNCMDLSSFGENTEKVYSSGTIGLSCSTIAFCFQCVTSCANLMYCMGCVQSRDCLGCVSLRRNQYCILNKQYSKKQYEHLAGKIVEHMQRTGEWGEYLPPALSRYGYNETIAQERFPLNAEQAAAQGFSWSDYDPPPPAGEAVQAADLPDDIAAAEDGVCSNAVLCEASGKPFRITEQELLLYRKLNVALPRRHPDERHFQRMSARNPQQLWERKCAKSGEIIYTSYAPDRPETVFGEKAYLDSLE